MDCAGDSLVPLGFVAAFYDDSCWGSSPCTGSRRDRGSSRCSRSPTGCHRSPGPPGATPRNRSQLRLIRLQRARVARQRPPSDAAQRQQYRTCMQRWSLDWLWSPVYSRCSGVGLGVSTLARQGSAGCRLLDRTSTSPCSPPGGVRRRRGGRRADHLHGAGAVRRASRADYVSPLAASPQGARTTAGCRRSRWPYRVDYWRGVLPPLSYAERHDRVGCG